MGNGPVNWLDPEGLVPWYGNWGGPGWSGGQNVSLEDLTSEEKQKLADPIDVRDECYWRHDTCYAGCTKECDKKARNECKIMCDKELSQCLAWVKKKYGYDDISDIEIWFFGSGINPWTRF